MADLDACRVRADAGSAVARLEALLLVCEQGLAIPQWLAEDLKHRIRRSLYEPVSLHDAFDLRSELPTVGKKAASVRIRMDESERLWLMVRSYQCFNGLTYSKALGAALKDGKFHFKKSTADKVFREQDGVQQTHGHPMAEKKRIHRLK